MRITLRQLEIFLAVVAEGGFSAAGQKLGMVQPAVSIAVRKLEDTLGLRLLDRFGHRVELTREGALFLRRAQAINAQIADTEHEFQSLRTLGAGHITIGAPPTVSGYMLPRFVERFLAARPGVMVTAVEDSALAVAERVRSGELDLGFVAIEGVSDALETTVVERHPIIACVPETSPLARRSIVDWPTLFEQSMILFPRGYNQRAILDDVAQRLKLKPKIVAESENGRFITSLVQAGLGISVLFKAVAAESRGLRALTIEGQPTLPISICRRRGSTLSHAAEAFFEAVTAAEHEGPHKRNELSRRK